MAQYGPICPNMSRYGPICPNMARIWPKYGPGYPSMARIWPEYGPKAPKTCPEYPKYTLSTGSREASNTAVPLDGGCGRGAGVAKGGQVWPRVPKVAKVGQNSHFRRNSQNPHIILMVFWLTWLSWPTLAHPGPPWPTLADPPQGPPWDPKYPIFSLITVLVGGGVPPGSRTLPPYCQRAS